MNRYEVRKPGGSTESFCCESIDADTNGTLFLYDKEDRPVAIFNSTFWCCAHLSACPEEGKCDGCAEA